MWRLGCFVVSICIGVIFMCQFVQRDRMCMHVSFSWSGLRLHKEMSCSSTCFFVVVSHVLVVSNFKELGICYPRCFP